MDTQCLNAMVCQTALCSYAVIVTYIAVHVTPLYMNCMHVTLLTNYQDMDIRSNGQYIEMLDVRVILTTGRVITKNVYSGQK